MKTVQIESNAHKNFDIHLLVTIRHAGIRISFSHPRAFLSTVLFRIDIRCQKHGVRRQFARLGISRVTNYGGFIHESLTQLYLCTFNYNVKRYFRSINRCFSRMRTFIHATRRLLAAELSRIKKWHGVRFASPAETALLVQFRAVHVRHLDRIDILRRPIT